jgi:hypothetical protein
MSNINPPTPRRLPISLLGIIRFLLGLILLAISFPLEATNVKLLDVDVWTTTFAAGAAITLHVTIDSLILLLGMSRKTAEVIHIPPFRMENKRLLSDALIVTSGVIVGLNIARDPGLPQLGNIMLVIGMILGFINLSVLGGSVHEELSIEVSTPPGSGGDPKTTKEVVVVDDLHHAISTWLLNAQFISLIIGVAAIV